MDLFYHLPKESRVAMDTTLLAIVLGESLFALCDDGVWTGRPRVCISRLISGACLSHFLPGFWGTVFLSDWRGHRIDPWRNYIPVKKV